MPPRDPREKPVSEPQRVAADQGRNVRNVFLLLFLLAALATRFYRLGERPFHHDESIHAFQSSTLAKDGTWRYDPAYHGPFLYYANAIVYKIAGVSNVTARFLPAVFGLLLIAFAWPLSRWIGKRAAVVYAVLVLISPHLAYFSRFIREDLYSLVFTLGTILAFRYFLETDKARWLTAAAVLFALAGVTKENAYMTGVLFVAFGFWAFLEKVVTARPRGGAVASTLTATVAWVRRHLVPLLTAGLVFLFIWALMYSAFGRYPGDWLAIPKAVKYWMGQHTISRIRGPWYYYFPQLVYYETGFLVAALFAFRKKRNDPFFGFLVFWAVGSLAIYAWAREKVPWLTVHPLLPITILAAIGIGDLWGDRIEKRWRAALAIIGLLLAVNTGGMVLACFRYGAHDVEREPRHAEMLAYVQTTQDFVRALEPVERAKLRVPAGQAVITVAGEATWPLTWYLRDVATRWLGRIEDASTPIIVADWNAEGGLEKQLADRYNAKRVPIRAWWFPESGSKGSGDGQFNEPCGVAVDPQGEIWVADTWNQRIVHFGPDGKYVGSFMDAEKGFFGPRAVIPSKNLLYVADTGNKRIVRFDRQGNRLSDWGGNGTRPGQFIEPVGLAADPTGNIYVADTGNHRVQVFDWEGKFLRQFPVSGWKDFYTEPYVAIGPSDSIFATDSVAGRVVQYDASGALKRSWKPDKDVKQPTGIALDALGRLTVSDRGTNHLFSWTPGALP